MTPKPQAMSNTLDEIRYKAIKFIQTVTAKNAQEPLSYLNDLLALITEARADERQAMLDALPGVNRIGYSGMCKTCEKPCDLDTCVCDGRNEAISEMKAAIKLMREEQL